MGQLIIYFEEMMRRKRNIYKRELMLIGLLKVLQKKDYLRTQSIWVWGVKIQDFSETSP